MCIYIYHTKAVRKWLVGAHAFINFDNTCFTYKVEIQCIIKRRQLPNFLVNTFIHYKKVAIYFHKKMTIS